LLSQKKPTKKITNNEELKLQTERLEFLEALLFSLSISFKEWSLKKFSFILDEIRKVFVADTLILYIHDFPLLSSSYLGIVGKRKGQIKKLKANFLKLGNDLQKKNKDVPNFKKFIEEKCKLPVKNFFAFPFKFRGKKSFVIFLNKTDRDDFSRNDKAFSRALVKQLIVWIDNFILVQQQKHRIKELSALSKIGEMLNSTLNLNELVFSLLENFEKYFYNVKNVGLCFLNEDKNRLHCFYNTMQNISSFSYKLQKKDFFSDILKSKKVVYENGLTNKVKNPFHKYIKKIESYIALPMVVDNNAVGILFCMNKKEHDFNEHDANFFSSIASQIAMTVQNIDLYEKRKLTLISTVKALAQAIEAKDPYTKGHSERVTEYSVLIAEALKSPDDVVDRVRLAGLLHDIGKIGIHDNILLKPGKLTDDEFFEIQKHPEIGEDILRYIEDMREILPGIRNHHERLDGNGYPDGLDDSKIPLLGRIIAVADAFDAMTSDRPYRKALSVDKAIQELKDFSGSQFDKKLVNLFITEYKKKYN